MEALKSYEMAYDPRLFPEEYDMKIAHVELLILAFLGLWEETFREVNKLGKVEAWKSYEMVPAYSPRN